MIIIIILFFTIVVVVIVIIINLPLFLLLLLLLLLLIIILILIIILFLLLPLTSPLPRLAGSGPSGGEGGLALAELIAALDREGALDDDRNNALKPSRFAHAVDFGQVGAQRRGFGQ
jgi:hypothetical protein